MTQENAHVPSATPTAIRTAAADWGLVLGGIALIGFLDYFTGTEVRVFTFYYMPLSYAAWFRGRAGTLFAVTVCTATWWGSNFLAGQHYSSTAIWVVNVFMQGASFAVVGMLISTLRLSLLKEQSLSRTDPLTSLLNGRAFYEEGERLLALCRRKVRPITVAYIDIDDFKAVNDRRGHPAGDALLRHVAARLRASIRPSDIAARLGGDEFVVLLPEVGADDGPATLERLRSVFADVQEADGPLTGSIGGVTFLQAPASVELMVQQADARMYIAKSQGKNRLHFEVA